MNKQMEMGKTMFEVMKMRKITNKTHFRCANTMGQ